VADSRLDELRRRLEKDPASRLFAQLAEQLRKEGELEEAIGVARTGLEKHPTYPSARLTLGRALLDSGDATAARAELDAAVQGAPDNILASRLLGETLETLGELKAAVEQLRTTLVMAPGDSQIEARIKRIEEELAKPAAPPSPSGNVEGQDHTKPRTVVSLDGGAGPGEATGSAEGEPPAPPAGEEEEEGDLPPTVRIRMPGDALGSVRAPLPPIPASADSVERGGAEGKNATPETSVAEPEPAKGAEAASPEVVPGTGSLDFVTTEGARRAAGDVTKPPLAPGVEDITTPPILAESPEIPRAAPPSEPATPSPVAPETPAGSENVGESGGQPLSSATLAELYLQQGLLERAIEVYREVLEGEPANADARARLAELEASLRASADETPTPAGEVGDERVAKRRALERTIGRLEALLAIVQRR